jgi:hypothetical protein
MHRALPYVHDFADVDLDAGVLLTPLSDLREKVFLGHRQAGSENVVAGIGPHATEVANVTLPVTE